MPPCEVPLGDMQLICRPSNLLVFVMESVEESHIVVIGASLTAMIPGKAGQLPELPLHIPVWLSVMLHEVVELDNFHTVLSNWLNVSSHVHVTTLSEVQKLSQRRVAWPALGHRNDQGKYK